MKSARRPTLPGALVWALAVAAALAGGASARAETINQKLRGAAAVMAPKSDEARLANEIQPPVKIGESAPAPMQAAPAPRPVAAGGAEEPAPRVPIQMSESTRALLQPGESLEINETMTPRDLLRDDERIRRLLREEAEFEYNPNERPDPMVAPWVRARVMARELTEIAENAVKANDLKKARAAYTMVRDLEGKLQASGFGAQSIQEFLAKAIIGLSQLQTLEQEAMQAQGSSQEAPKLPTWVSNNTRGIIFDTVEPICLVGPYTLREGESVPNQPVEVTVAKINPASVVYKVRDTTFEVGIEEGE